MLYMVFFGRWLRVVRFVLIFVVFICFGVVMIGRSGCVIGVNMWLRVLESWLILFMFIVENGGVFGFFVSILDWKYLSLKFVLWLLIIVIILMMLVYFIDWWKIFFVYVDDYLKLLEKLWNVDMIWECLCLVKSCCLIFLGS